MLTPCTPLPGEVWTLVFGFLSLSDRLRVRATCKYFLELVDNSRLWRDWTAMLWDNSDGYEERYWRMLRRWRVTSVLLSSPNSWIPIALELPGLTTLIISDYMYNTLQDTRIFTNLRRLHIAPCSLDLIKLSLHRMPQQLTHLTVCCTASKLFPSGSHFTSISPKSPFKKLKSFVCHYKFNSNPVNVLHVFLLSLPQLEHLSLTFTAQTPCEGQISDLTPLRSCSLSSLELVECNLEYLPVDLRKMLNTLPFLRSLAIFLLTDEGPCSDNDLLKLSVWLKDLPRLSSLLVRGAKVGGFVSSIPSSVTRLTLLPPSIDSKEMTQLSAHQLKLLHLHLDPYYTFLGSNTALIPQLFPGLRTLRLRHEKVPEDAVLSLALLKELEVLETQDREPLPAALACQLRALTNNRVRIYKSPEKIWLRSCSCMSYIPSDYWASA